MSTFEVQRDPNSGDEIWTLRLTRRDHAEMDQEQLEMIQDGLWLIGQAIRRQKLTGPLTLPSSDLPVRRN